MAAFLDKTGANWLIGKVKEAVADKADASDTVAITTDELEEMWNDTTADGEE
jgi:hypothetical protein